LVLVLWKGKGRRVIFFLHNTHSVTKVDVHFKFPYRRGTDRFLEERSTIQVQGFLASTSPNIRGRREKKFNLAFSSKFRWVEWSGKATYEPWVDFYGNETGKVTLQ
jgi:hypothetical protein